MRLFILSFIVIFSFSCNNIIEKDIDTVLNSETENDDKVIINMDKPMIIDSTDYIIFPIGNVNHNKRKSYSIESSSDSYQYFGQYNNIVFYDKINNNYHVLNDSALNIQDFNIFRNFYEQLQKVYIFYNIYDTDFNKDGKIDYQDPTSLYISDANGHNFMKVLPENLSLIDITPDKIESKIYIRAYSDSNNDFIFNSSDKISILCFDLKQPNKKAHNVFDNKFITKLESLLINK